MMDERLKYLSILNMIKKYYELSRWERVRHWDEIHTFDKMDWMYCRFKNENGDIIIGSYDSYELGDDWIYNIVLGKQ